MKHIGILLAVVLLMPIAVASTYVQTPALGRDSTTDCVPFPEGLTAWWPGDGSTEDPVGGFTAQLRGDATFGEGLVGQAFHLDRAGDSYVDVPHDPALNVGDGDFTVVLWVYFNDRSGEQVLIEKYVETYGPDAAGWFLTSFEDGGLRFGSAGGFDSDPGLLPAETWIHVAARRSGDIGTIFVNGQNVGEGTLDSLIDSEASMKFGYRGGPNDTPGSVDDRSFYLDGRIDEVEYYVGSALTDAEILAIAQAGSAGRCPIDDVITFTGFYAPLKGTDTVMARAGQGLPVKWNTFSNGVSVEDSASDHTVTSREVGCDLDGPGDNPPVADAAGNSALRWDPDAGQYIFVWKTSRSWVNTCHELTVTYQDTPLTVQVNFTR
jgi:hypothetical protein